MRVGPSRVLPRMLTIHGLVQHSIRLAIVLGLCGAAGWGQTPVTPSDLPLPGAGPCPEYLRAKEAFKAKRFPEAAELFGAAALMRAKPQRCPSDAPFQQARSLVEAGSLTRADSLLRTLIEQGPTFAPALYLLGYVLERENMPKDSLALFTRAAAFERPVPEDLRLVALDYVLLEDYVDAIRWLKRAVAEDERNREAWYDLGRAQMHEGNFAEAERAFNRTLVLDPRNVKAMDNLGLSYEGMNRSEEAIAMYQRAIAAQSAAVHPSEQPLLNLGTLLITKNRSAEAVTLLLHAVALAPACVRCLEELARAYRFTQQDELALATMKRAVALDAANPRLHFQLGQMYRRAGQPEQAEVELRLSSHLYGDHSTSPEK